MGVSDNGVYPQNDRFNMENGGDSATDLGVPYFIDIKHRTSA